MAIDGREHVKVLPAGHLSTTRCMEAELDTENHFIDMMDFLHRVFADSANQDVNLSKLSIDDFGLSTDLNNKVRTLLDEGIRTIPSDENKRQTIAATMNIG